MKYTSLLLTFLLLGCSANKKQAAISQSDIPVINLSENVSAVTSLPLSEAASKVDIVCLEMTDESILGEINQVQVTDQNIWIDPVREFYIYRFSRNGKFLNRIGIIGQGPGEYYNFSTFLVNEDKNEVYIISGNDGVLVYDFDGKFKKKIADFQTLQNLFSSMYAQYVLNNQTFFATQNTALYKPIDKDSLWSFASLGDSFQEKNYLKIRRM